VEKTLQTQQKGFVIQQCMLFGRKTAASNA
jgi:hypothetical protein